MSAKLSLSNPDHFRIEELLERWGVSAGRFDDYVSEGLLRRAWRIDGSRPEYLEQSLHALPLNSLPAATLVELKQYASCEGYFHDIYIGSIDEWHLIKPKPWPFTACRVEFIRPNPVFPASLTE